MMPDISQLSVEELKRLQEQAEALIASKKDEAIDDAYQQIIAIADKVGLSIEQILEYGASKRKKTVRKAVEPRYRSKANPEDTWTGRGKQPRWLVAELDGGATLEDFLI
jgi:DNA-binding protein H-NS